MAMIPKATKRVTAVALSAFFCLLVSIDRDFIVFRGRMGCEKDYESIETEGGFNAIVGSSKKECRGKKIKERSILISPWMTG